MKPTKAEDFISKPIYQGEVLTRVGMLLKLNRTLIQAYFQTSLGKPGRAKIVFCNENDREKPEPV